MSVKAWFKNGKRVCRGCRRAKESSQFFKAEGSPDGRRSKCKRCITKQNLAWRDKNPDQHKAIYRRANHRMNIRIRFGLSLEQFDLLWSKCNGRCSLCSKTESRDRRLSLDHDHKTGELRGFICSRCNLLLGNAADDPNLLKRAARYLERPPLRICAPRMGWPKVKIKRSGYDPRLSRYHPNNFDPTLETKS